MAKAFTMSPDWVDHLGLDEIRSIIAGWHDAIRYWSSQGQRQGLMTVQASVVTAERYVSLAKSRVLMWDEVLESRTRGERSQHILWRYRKQES